MAAPAAVATEGTLFGRLRAACDEDWRRYTGHEFVRRLGDGTLPEACFQHYLIQDYLFLIQFARAYGLAVYKADDLGDMRQAAAAVAAILDVEMGLHLRLSATWGLSEAALAAQPEDTRNMAYTRFVLERGLAGDLLDLHAALAPCVVGYAEIGAALAAAPVTGNPYAGWIETYAGDDYRALAVAEIAQLDRLARTRAGLDPAAGTGGRFGSLVATFRAATRLETGFWQMGLDAAD